MLASYPPSLVVPRIEVESPTSFSLSLYSKRQIRRTMGAKLQPEVGKNALESVAVYGAAHEQTLSLND